MNRQDLSSVNTDSGLFSLRDPCEEDLVAVNQLLELEGFPFLDNLEGLTIATNSDDELIGFVHTFIADDGFAYIYPVVVYESWRGYKVGVSLVQRVIDRYAKVKLVSRGYARGFYDQMGFEKTQWESIDERIVAECDECELREECEPQPYCLVKEK